MRRKKCHRATQVLPCGGFELDHWALWFFKNLAGLWLARLINNHVGIYGCGRGFFGVPTSVLLFLCGFGWDLCRTTTTHSAHCHCPLYSDWGWSPNDQNLSMPCLNAAGPWKYFLAFMSQGEICISGKLSVQEPSEWGGFFAYLQVIWLYFSLESSLIPAVLELCQVRLFWKLIRSRIWQLSHNCQTGIWEYFLNSLSLK